MKKTIFSLMIVLIAAFIASDENTEAFLNYYPTSFGEGTAGAIIASSYAEHGSFYYNPASSSSLKGFSLLYEHKFLLSNLSQYNSLFIYMPSLYGVNIGLAYINQYISRIPIYPEYDSTASFIPEGYFSDNANCFIFNISYGFLEDIYSAFRADAGLNVKMIYHTIYENTGTGAGIDIGFRGEADLSRIKSGMNGRLDFALGADDISGTSVVWDTDSKYRSSRGASIKAGLGYEADIKSISSTARFETDITRSFSITKAGASFIYDFNRSFALYCGTDYIFGSNGGFADSGAGARIKLIGISLSYAVSKYDLGINHSVSVSYSL